MNLLFLFLIQNALMPISYAADGPEPTRDYSVPPNYFREFYLRNRSIMDLAVKLDGEWTDAQVKRLAEVLGWVNSRRKQRPASIAEWPYSTKIVFKTGSVFAIDRDEQHFENSAAIWGNGISGETTLILTVAMTASDSEIEAYLQSQLPDIVVKDPADRARWQAELAGMQRGRYGICASLFKSARHLRFW